MSKDTKSNIVDFEKAKADRMDFSFLYDLITGETLTKEQMRTYEEYCRARDAYLDQKK